VISWTVSVYCPHQPMADRSVRLGSCTPSKARAAASNYRNDAAERWLTLRRQLGVEAQLTCSVSYFGCGSRQSEAPRQASPPSGLVIGVSPVLTTNRPSLYVFKSDVNHDASPARIR
jgi:hypothetical protein